MTYYKHLLAFVIFLVSARLCAQFSYIPYESQAYYFKDRVNHIYHNDESFHSAVHKLQHDYFLTYLEKIQNLPLSERDRQEWNYYLKDLNYPDSINRRKGLLEFFYTNPAHFFELETEDFRLRVDPFINFNLGRQNPEGDLIFLNKRGLELWGELDKKFSFYSAIHENQSNFFNYIENFIAEYRSIPGQGHYKAYQSGLIQDFSGYDYANAQAYLMYKTSKHSLLELGHGRHFIGNGVRSVLLSDFAHNYLYLRFNVKVWKIHYQTVIAELSPFSSRNTVGNTVLPKKYMASHYLSFKPSGKFEIGLFESVVFARENQFEFHYLNPVILYRTAEALIDSPDNVILGMNLNWIFANKTSVYGQVLIDELRTSEIFSGNNWWGNKWATQIGIKSFDLLGINSLDVQLEYNRVRPYTYSHNVSLQSDKSRSLTSFSHFNQALAHPLGSNFSEVIIRLMYTPLPNLYFRAQYLYSRQGLDREMMNFGSDILLNNESRIDDFGIEHLQGNLSRISSFDLQASYRLFHEFYIDLYLKLRTAEDQFDESLETNYWGMGFRYNIENRNIDY